MRERGFVARFAGNGLALADTARSKSVVVQIDSRAATDPLAAAERLLNNDGACRLVVGTGIPAAPRARVQNTGG